MVGDPPRLTMRTVATLAIVALMVTAGCVGSITGGDGGDGGDGDGAADGPPSLSAVPAKAQMVLSYDADVVTDPTTQAAVNAYLEEAIPEDSGQPRTVQGILDQAEGQMSGQTNLSLASVSGMTMFVEYPSMGMMSNSGAAAQETTPYVGVLLRTGWDEDEVISLIEQESEVAEETYEGTTIYTSTESGTTAALAKYDDNEWAIGSVEAVKDAIDVNAGDASAVSGQLKTAYENTNSDGYVRFAATIPEQYRRILNSPMAGDASMGGVSASSFTNVTAVAGSYYTEGGQGQDGTVGMGMSMYFDGSDPADSVRRQIDGALALFQDNVQNETIETQLESIEVGGSDNTVTVTYESSISDLETLFEQFLNLPYGMGGFGPGVGSSTSAAVSEGTSSGPGPQVTFSYDYDPDSGTVTVVHAGGDSIDGGDLRVQCSADILEVPSGEIETGDTVVRTGECEPGTTLLVVMQTSDGSQRILGEYDIPQGARLAR